MQRHDQRSHLLLTLPPLSFCNVVAIRGEIYSTRFLQVAFQDLTTKSCVQPPKSSNYILTKNHLDKRQCHVYSCSGLPLKLQNPISAMNVQPLQAVLREHPDECHIAWTSHGLAFTICHWFTTLKTQKNHRTIISTSGKGNTFLI